MGQRNNPYLVGPEKPIRDRSSNQTSRERAFQAVGLAIDSVPERCELNAQALNQDKKNLPHPFVEVPCRRRELQVYRVSQMPFEEAANKAVVVFQMTDHRFDRRSSSKPFAHLFLC